MGKDTRPTKRVQITFIADVIIREGFSVKRLIKKETEFLAEPKSANGCVKDLILHDVVEIL